MKPFIVDRREEQRRREEWQPVPLRIQPPPPEWIEEQGRRRERPTPTDRGVSIVGNDGPGASERGVYVFDL